MAKRSISGQLNMFDFWNNLTPPGDGDEVQMVSLIPEEEGEVLSEETVVIEHVPYNEEQEAESTEETEEIDETEKEQPVMSKQRLDALGNCVAEVSFYNYNRVCVKYSDDEAKWHVFDNAKEAVDCYYEEIQKMLGEAL